MQEYSQLHSLPSPRLLVTIPSYFLNFPPKPLHARVISTSQSPLPKTSCHDTKSFLKLPPLKPYMQKYSQLHSLHSPRLLVTIPSHFLNFPPQTLHARVFSTSQSPLSKTSCHDSKSFLKLPPPNLTCKSILNFTVSPLQDFLSRFLFVFQASAAMAVKGWKDLAVPGSAVPSLQITPHSFQITVPSLMFPVSKSHLIVSKS